MKYKIEIIKNEERQSLEAVSELEGVSSYDDISKDMLALPSILGCAYGHMLRDTVFKDAMTPTLLENFTKWMNVGPAFCRGVELGLKNEVIMEEEV